MGSTGNRGAGPNRARARLRALHDQLGTAGLVLAIAALVIALTGTAFAAQKFITKKEAIKIAKKYAGKPGATGPAGPQGPAGQTGAQGNPGAPGSPGAPGKDGKSTVVTAFGPTSEPAGEPCEENGGQSVEVEGSGVKKFICNGAEGPEGAEGSPWTAGGVLPPGKTETGSWSVSGTTGPARVPILFTLPLADPLSGDPGCLETPLPATCQVHYINSAGKEVSNGEEVTPAYCAGGTAADPKAAPGHLCVYAAHEANLASSDAFIRAAGEEEPVIGASTAGAYLLLIPTGEGPVGWGTWAVTAPTATP